MNILKLFTTILIFTSLAACEKNADTSIPLNYAKDNISFAYPENWTVTEDKQEDDVRFLSIEAPGDAIVLVQIYSTQDAASLKEYAEWFSKEVIKDTPVVESSVGDFEDIKRTINAVTLTGMRQKFSITLLGTDVPYTAEYYRIENDNRVAFLISQTAAEDLAKVNGGFELLLGTFVIN